MELVGASRDSTGYGAMEEGFISSLSPQWPSSYAGHVLTGCSPRQLQAFLALGHQSQAHIIQDGEDSWFMFSPRGASFQCWFHSTQDGDIRLLHMDWLVCRDPGEIEDSAF